MKTIKQNELYRNLSDFLRSRGIEFTEGSYTARIRQSCSLLTQAINSAQQGLHTAKTEVDRKLDGVRQVIHEKTAPRPPAATATPPKAGPGAAPKPTAKSRKPRTGPAGPKARKPAAAAPQPKPAA